MAQSMIGFRDQITEVLRAMRVTSPTSYAWFGRPAPPLKRVLRTTLGPPAARRYLVARLERELYESFYLPGEPRPRSTGTLAADAADTAFVGRLCEANKGRGSWGGEWRVVEVAEGGAIVAERDGLQLRMDASDYRADRDGPLAPGASVSVRLPKDEPAASPGFYLAHGDAAAGDSAAVEVRVYFNLTHTGAVPLLATATRVLNDEGIAFSLKLVDHPAHYFRCDAGVLYLDRTGFMAARKALQALVAACATHLRAGTPAFTKPLARGVGLGEHDATLGASFGSGRCRLLAEGIVDAHDRRLTALADRVDAVADRFALHGIDIEQPYLISGGGDGYVL